MSTRIYSSDHLSIASLLHKARSEAKLTQTEVAEILGVTQSQISKIEAGHTRIDIVLIKEFARIYNKNVNWFLK